MSWNTTKGTYQLNLLARIPINNPNFLNVRRPQLLGALPLPSSAATLLWVPPICVILRALPLFLPEKVCKHSRRELR